MEKINGVINATTVSYSDFKDYDNKIVSIKGYIQVFFK